MHATDHNENEDCPASNLGFHELNFLEPTLSTFSLFAPESCLLRSACLLRRTSPGDRPTAPRSTFTWLAICNCTDAIPEAHDRTVNSAAGHDAISRLQVAEHLLELLTLLRLRPQNQEIPDGEEGGEKEKQLA